MLAKKFFCSWPGKLQLVGVYKLDAIRKAFYLATFFSIQASRPKKSFFCAQLFSQYNTRLLRQKAVGACLYMPQVGHWLASFEVSRIQLAPHARRRAVPMTVSEWVPVLCADDEVAKSGRTGMTTAYTEDMLSRERTMDCTMHRLLGENTIY